MKILLLVSMFFILTGGLSGLIGYGTSAPVANDNVDPSLTILAPNGGEAWYIGDTNNITWTATDTNLNPNSIYLWYTMDGGTSYTPIASAITNSGSYPWAMPSIQSYNTKVRIKVSDSFGNFTQKSSASPFSITYVPPSAPLGVNIDTSNNLDAVITWQPVTQTIYSTPIAPDGYIVLYNETPYEGTQFYYFLGRSFTNTYTHHDVAEFRSQMYYKVVAYKNYREESLQELEKNALTKRLLWKDALQTLERSAE